MSPLTVLTGTFLLSITLPRLFKREVDYALSARIAMSVMLLFTAIGHFKFTDGMELMLPAFIPFKTEVVIITGLIEIGIAIGLLIPSSIKISGWTLMIFLVLVLPANIHAAVNHVDFQTASFDGNGPNYLWFRIPVQLFFIAWAYLSTMDPCPFSIDLDFGDDDMLFV